MDTLFFYVWVVTTVPLRLSVLYIGSESLVYRLKYRVGQLPQAHPHTTSSYHLKVTPIRDFIYHLTANFFDRCPAHPNPLVRSIANYSLADLHHQYKKYIHKRPKHILF